MKNHENLIKIVSSYIVAQNHFRELVGTPIKDLLTFHAKQLINENDQENFIADVYEDLKQMDESRVIGLGITLDQLKTWLEA